MKKIIVVDDEIDICKLLAIQLKSLGIQAEYATTIREARTKITDTTYDVIFIDLNLPDGTGYDLINFIKEKEITSHMIVISAYSFDSTLIQSNGVKHFLPKPFSRKSVEKVLQELEVLT